MEGGNVLHHMKIKGGRIVREGRMSGGICPDPDENALKLPSSLLQTYQAATRRCVGFTRRRCPFVLLSVRSLVRSYVCREIC